MTTIYRDWYDERVKLTDLEKELLDTDYSNYTDLDWIRFCYKMAAKYATDPSTQNACAILDAQGKFVCADANHFPLNVVEAADRWVRPLKYQFVEHAERGAIYKAGRLGKSVVGGKIYGTWMACSDCSRGIIESGLKEAIAHEFFAQSSHTNWQDSISVGLTMMKEAGVNFRTLNDLIGGVKVRFNGNIVEP